MASFQTTPRRFQTAMPSFSELDNHHIIPGIPNASTDLNYAHFALSQLVDQEEHDDSNGRAKKLGLRDSGKITLDIIDGAQRARSHRKTCIVIAEQAYQLVNAVDAGVKGGVLDTDEEVLQEHITGLNNDLNQIRQTIKRLGTWWWIFPRICCNAEKELGRCREILDRRMDMYVSLLRCALAQPDERQAAAAAAESLRKTPPIESSSSPN